MSKKIPGLGNVPTVDRGHRVEKEIPVANGAPQKGQPLNAVSGGKGKGPK
jgi:hypothetical protein